MSELLVSEVDAEPKRSVRATVRNFEKIVDSNTSHSPDTRGNNSPDTRPRQIHKLKFLGEHKSFESSSPPGKESALGFHRHSDEVTGGGDHEIKDGGTSEQIIHMTLAERLEALQSSSSRAFETSRSAKINAQPISRIRDSLRQSMDNLQSMIILRPPDAGVRTVADIRDAIRKSKENLYDDDSVSKSDGQINVDDPPAGGVYKPIALPRPAPRRSKMLKIVANRSQSCENLLAGDDELVAMTSPPKTTKSFTKADCVQSLREISDAKADTTSTVRSKSDVQSSIRRASYRAAERMEIADKPAADKPKTNVSVRTEQTEHLSPKCERPALPKFKFNESLAEKSDARLGEELDELVEVSPETPSTNSDHLHSVYLIRHAAVASDTETLLASSDEAELSSPTSNDINDLTNEKKNTDRPSPSRDEVQGKESFCEKEKASNIRKFASTENIASSDANNISYDPATDDLAINLPLGPIHEEFEYDRLAGVFVENILDEQRKLCVVVSPGRDLKTAVDYVYPLFNMSSGASNTGEELVLEEEFTDFEAMKEVLLTRAVAKLAALTAAKDTLTTKIEELKQVESELDALVKSKADDRQFGKYRVCIEEMEKVVHLLLMLSGRLARLHNSISGLEEGEEAAQQQKTVLSQRYKELLQKHDDAASLKESIDHRTCQLALYLATVLDPQEFKDYRRFVATKSRCQLARQSLEDRASLAEEQIRAIGDCRAGEVFVNMRSPTDVGGTGRETDV